jgi:hypothetical protein
MRALTCLLCGQRKARRACPALGHQICTVCCATKRLGEIHCPSDCTYLAVAREHPPAAAVRQQQRDVALAVRLVRDFNQRQSQLFLLAGRFLTRYPSPDLQPLLDEDVAEAAAALAATFETSSRGLIFDHRPASLPADRLRTALKPLLAEAGRNGGTAFDRDAAVVLRRVEEAVREVRGIDPQNRRAFLDLLGRVLKRAEEPEEPEAPGDAPRLIIP